MIRAMALGLTWLGQHSFIIDDDAGTTLAIDPFAGGRALTPADLASLAVWLQLPWTAKMVFSEFVDAVPIFGSQRRAYTFIGAGGCRLMCAWDTAPDTVDRVAAEVAKDLVKVPNGEIRSHLEDVVALFSKHHNQDAQVNKVILKEYTSSLALDRDRDLIGHCGEELNVPLAISVRVLVILNDEHADRAVRGFQRYTKPYR